MWYPQNPKILVVDDQHKDVKLLLESFTSKGIPHIYFEAKRNSELEPPVYSFPEKPLLGVRFVVLDIELEGVTDIGGGDKNVALALINHLRRLMNLKESSYAVLFWTKRKDLIELVLDYLKKANEEPIASFNMEKPAASDLNLEYINQKFFSSFHNDAFEFLLTWEDAIYKNAANFVNTISNIVKQESNAQKTEWSDTMKVVLSKLASSYLGTKKIATSKINDAVKYATEVFNKSFLEELKIDDSQQIELPQSAQLSLNTIAKLNEFLFVENVKDNIISNGKVFFLENEKLHNILKRSIVRNSELDKWETKLIATILTPNCDLAHNKFLKEENGIEYHRTLLGLKIIVQDSFGACFEHNAKRSTRKKDINTIIEIDLSLSRALADCISSGKFNVDAEKEFKAIDQKIRKGTQLKTKIMERFPENRPEYLYVTQPFMDANNKIAIFAFHFGTVMTIPIDLSRINFNYLMKNDLISDLQTKLANHVNRLGHSMLEF